MEHDDQTTIPHINAHRASHNSFERPRPPPPSLPTIASPSDEQNQITWSNRGVIEEPYLQQAPWEHHSPSPFHSNPFDSHLPPTNRTPLYSYYNSQNGAFFAKENTIPKEEQDQYVPYVPGGTAEEVIVVPEQNPLLPQDINYNHNYNNDNSDYNNDYNNDNNKDYNYNNDNNNNYNNYYNNDNNDDYNNDNNNNYNNNYNEYNNDYHNITNRNSGSISSHPREGWPAWQWPTCMFIFILSFVLIGYDVSNVANIQASIYKAFGNTDLLPLVALAYAAAGMAVVPLIRRLLVTCSLRLQCVIYALTLFIGSTMCGAAPGMGTMIAGRFITGIGGAGIYQVMSTFVLTLTTPEEFSRANGLVAAAWATGLVLGPIVGGALAQNKHTTWRWAFYINLPLIGSIILLIIVAIPPTRLQADGSVVQFLQQLDWVGCFLHVAGVILLLLCLVFSGSSWKWHSPTAAAWVFTGILFVLYVKQQMEVIFTTRDRQYFPAKIFQKRVILLAGLATSAASSVYGIALYYTPLFFAFAKGHDPVTSAVHIIPFTVSFIAAVLLVGGLLPIIRYQAPIYMVAGTLITVGGALQTTIKSDTSQSRVMGIEALIGIGAGMSFQLGFPVFAQSLPTSRRLEASVAFITMQLGGISVGLAIAGAIYQNVGYEAVKAALAGADSNLDLSPQEIRDALAGLDSRILTSPELAQLAVKAVIFTLARINYMLVSAGALIFVLGFWMKWEPLVFKNPADKSEEMVENV